MFSTSTQRILLSSAASVLFVAVAVALHSPSFDAPAYYDTTNQLINRIHLFASGDLASVIGIFPQRPVTMASLYGSYLLSGMDLHWFRVFNAALLGLSALAASVAAYLLLGISGHRATHRTGNCDEVSDPAKSASGGKRARNVQSDRRGGARGRARSRAESGIPPQDTMSDLDRMAAARGAYAARESAKGASDLRAGDEALVSTQIIIALAVGLLFLVHPVQTYVVTYVWQRAALLAVFFSLSSFAAYLAARTGRIKSSVFGYGLAIVLFCLALGSKENAVALPVMIVVLEAAFFSSDRSSMVKRGLAVAGVVIACVAAMSLIERPHGVGSDASGIVAAIETYYAEGGLTPAQVIVSQCRALFSYLALLCFPTPSNVQFAAAFPVSSSLFGTPADALFVLGAAALIIAGLVLLRLRPLSGFGLLFFLATLAPESILVPQYLLFGFRAVLPLFGLLLIVADGMGKVIEITEPHRGTAGKMDSRVAGKISPVPPGGRTSAVKVLGAAGFGCVLALLAAATVSKARVWTNPVAFWSEIVDRLPPEGVNPGQLIAVHSLVQLGSALRARQRSREALDVLQRALTIEPQDAAILSLLGMAFQDVGDLEAAESSLQKAVELNPRSSASQFALGRFLVDRDRPAEASVHMQKAVELAPGQPILYNALGSILLRQGFAAEAASQFRTAIRLAPTLDEPYLNLGDALSRSGNDSDAIEALRQAVRLSPRNWRAHNNLGMIFTKLGKTEEAERHFLQAIALAPKNWRIHNNLGVVLAKSGKYDAAERHFREALKIKPEDSSARKNLDRLMRIHGAVPGK